MPRMSRRLIRTSALIPALVAISLLGATRTCDMQVYGLTADSTFSEGCYPPLLCPVLIGPDLGGTFRLREVSRSARSPFRWLQCWTTGACEFCAKRCSPFVEKLR